MFCFQIKLIFAYTKCKAAERKILFLSYKQMPNKYEKQGYTAVRTDDDDHYSRYKEVTIRNSYNIRKF